MADIASPQNTSSQSLDALVKTAGATPYLKQGKGSKSASGVDDAVAGQVVHFDSSTATWTSVAAGTAAGGTVLASNVERIGATISNASTAICYIAYGTAASATRYSVTLAGTSAGAAAYLEVPYGYTGIITGSWTAANGSAYVTEFTA